MADKLKIRHLIAAAFVALLACSIAGAQMRGGGIAGRMAPTRMGSPARISSAARLGPIAAASTQGIRQATVIRILPNGRVASGYIPLTGPTRFGNVSGVPGLGFDFPHLAAVTAPLQSNQSFRFGRGGRRGQGNYVPILFGGYPYYYDPTDYDQSQQQTQPQPQVIVVQQSTPTDSGQQNVDSGNDSFGQTAPAAAPVPDIGDFILVRRDGRILFASAFSIVGTQMQYVSPEGIRHTLPMADLDANATQQMNEARGTTVQISN